MLLKVYASPQPDKLFSKLAKFFPKLDKLISKPVPNQISFSKNELKISVQPTKLVKVLQHKILHRSRMCTEPKDMAVRKSLLSLNGNIFVTSKPFLVVVLQ